MTFYNIQSIDDLPFRHNQNTNSSIISQKYLTNSFSDIPTNTQPTFTVRINMKTKYTKNALGKARRENEVGTKIN